MHRVRCLTSLIDGNAELSELNLSLLDLRRELLVCVGDVVEGKDAESEPKEEVCAEGDESPEGKLYNKRQNYHFNCNLKAIELTTGTICSCTRGGRGISSR